MALHLSDINTWKEDFQNFYLRFSPYLGRKEVRREAKEYLHGLLAPIEKKNGWNIAELQDKQEPQAMQRLLRTARLNRQEAQREMKQIVREHFACNDGIFVLDETGFPKSGEDSVGVKRQYCGVLGKVDHCQVGVFLSYSSSKGRAVLDHRLYLPNDWGKDVERREKAHVPEKVLFKTKPLLAQEMLETVFAENFPGEWGTADTLYGGNPSFRRFLLERNHKFVLAVPYDTLVWSQGPKMKGVSKSEEGIRGVVDPTHSPKRMVSQLAHAFRSHRWKRLRIVEGSKGWREYDWAAKRVTLCEKDAPQARLWVLVRRSISKPEERAYYLCHAPTKTPLETLVFVAASRWTIETCFKECKGEVGMDQYQVRTWEGWHRHTLFSMMAHLFLSIVRQKYEGKQECEWGVLSIPEIRRLFEVVFPLPQRSKSSKWRWSVWRRSHNEKSRRSHYKRRGHSLPISEGL